MNLVVFGYIAVSLLIGITSAFSNINRLNNGTLDIEWPQNLTKYVEDVNLLNSEFRRKMPRERFDDYVPTDDDLAEESKN